MTAWRDGGNPVPELDANTTAAVMSNGLVCFNATGDVQILSLQSECITPNGVAATTIQYNITPTGLVATTISGASASLASALAGTLVALDGTALSTAPNIYANGCGLGQTARGVIFQAGALSLVVAAGPTTGTWKHYMRYRPMEAGAVVTPAF
jgi:hypothetical protein